MTSRTPCSFRSRAPFPFSSGTKMADPPIQSITLPLNTGASRGGDGGGDGGLVTFSNATFCEASPDELDELSVLSFLDWSDFEEPSLTLAVCAELPFGPALSNRMNPSTAR